VLRRRERGAGPLGRVAVHGRSMEPTLSAGDALLVRWGGRVQPGRLVVLRLPDGVLAVKRAAQLTAEGWWVERDNPDQGVDSWRVGAIPEADVLGVVLLRYWPRPALFTSPARR
jgi:nickel-type superoxide dismutase maturation protease